MQVVLNIGSRDIRLIAAREDKILKWQTSPINPGLVKDGDIRQPKELAGVIDSLFIAAKLPRDQVAVCVEGLSFTYRTLNLPRLKSPLMEEAVERAARKEIPLPLDELYFEWLITGGTGDEVEIFFVGAPRSLIDTIVETLKMAKVDLRAIGLRSLALARAAGKSDALIVDFEPDCFDITIISGGVPAIMHTVTPRGDRSNLEDNIAQLVDELNRTIDFYNISHTKNPVESAATLLLSGSLALEESVAGRIGKGTGHPVDLITTRLPLPSGLPAALYAGNIGLITRKAVRKAPADGAGERYYDINIDLLNGKRRALHRPVYARTPLIPVLLFVFLVLLLIPVYFARNNAGADAALRQTELDRLNRELRLARAQSDISAQTEASIQKLLDESKNLEKSYETIGGRSETSAILEFIAAMMPGEAHYTSIDIGPKQISVDGEAARRSDVVEYAVRLEKYSKFTGVRIALIEDKTVGSGGGNEAGNKGGGEGGNEVKNAGVTFSIVINR